MKKEMTLLSPLCTVDELVALINTRLCDWKSRDTGHAFSFMGKDEKMYDSIPAFFFKTEAGDEICVSIQAGKNNYSSPRENEVDEFRQVELGFPTWVFLSERLLEDADDRDNPMNTIYSYVPLRLVALEILSKIREHRVIEVIPVVAVIHTVDNTALWS